MDRLTTEVAALNQGLGALSWKKQSLNFPLNESGEYYCWINDKNEMLLSFGIVFDTSRTITIPNETIKLWSFCNTPDNIFNITNVGNIIYAGNLTIIERDTTAVLKPALYRIGIVRQNNITYIGLIANNTQSDFTAYVGSLGAYIKIK